MVGRGGDQAALDGIPRVRPLLGLALLFLAFAAAGGACLWAVGAIPTWTRLLRLGGLAYLVGFALCGSIWTLLLIVGAPFTGATVAAVPTALVCASIAIGWRLGRAPPSGGTARPKPGVSLVVATVAVGAMGVFYEALFRAGRLQGLQSYDGWAFWIPKAKAVFLFHGLDEQFFTLLAGRSYPPLVPAVDAAAFHAMGGIDAVSLHLQFWVVALALGWAVAGLLTGLAPGWLAWPFILLALVAPRVGDRLLIPQADTVVYALVVPSVLLMVAWTRKPERWHLVVSAILLAGAANTKREGLLLAAVVLAAAGVATVSRLRRSWPSLAVVGATVVAAAIPWRIWFASKDITGEGPAGGVLGAGDRAWPALRLAVGAFFDSALWSLLATAVVASLLLGLLARTWRTTAFLGAFLGLGLVSAAWIVWIYPEIPLTTEESTNPLVRYLVALVLASAVAAPVVLADVWAAADRGEGAE